MEGDGQGKFDGMGWVGENLMGWRCGNFNGDGVKMGKKFMEMGWGWVQFLPCHSLLYIMIKLSRSVTVWPTQYHAVCDKFRRKRANFAIDQDPVNVECRPLWTVRTVSLSLYSRSGSSYTHTYTIHTVGSQQPEVGHSIECITHANHSITFCTLWPRPFDPKIISLVEYPKVIPCTKFEHFGIIHFWVIVRTNRRR